MVAPVARAWIRQDGDPRPLQARWEDVSAQLAQLGGSPVVPASEIGIQEMQSSIRHLERERRAAAEPVRNEMLISARREFSGAVDRYRMAHTYIVESQQKLQRLAADPIYALLFDMGAVLQAPIGPRDWLDAHFDNGRKTSEDLFRVRQPTFASVSDYRAAMNLLSNAARELEDRQAAIIEVCRFPNDDVGERLRKITLGLLRRLDAQTVAITALSRRLDEIAGQVNTLTAEVARLGRYTRFMRRQTKGK
jgi:hypothetical protein